MVRMIVALLIVTALSVTFGAVACAEMAKQLKAGIPNTITLANGGVVYDLNGEWDGIARRTGATKKEFVRISQQDDNFVGINLIGYGDRPKGSEVIKGTLEQNGFKEASWNCFYRGWTASKGEISEDGNKMIIKYRIERHPSTFLPYDVVLTFQKK